MFMWLCMCYGIIVERGGGRRGSIFHMCICVIECIECIECTECIECIECIE